MVDACTAAGILPFYGPFGDIRDLEGCEAQFRAAFLMGCVGAWSLHPAQIDVAKKVFSPDPDEVAFARKVIEAIPDGRGVHMIDGKMQDDATWKQCRVMVDLAEMLAAKDPELAEAYGSGIPVHRLGHVAARSPRPTSPRHGASASAPALSMPAASSPPPARSTTWPPTPRSAARASSSSTSAACAATRPRRWSSCRRCAGG